MKLISAIAAAAILAASPATVAQAQDKSSALLAALEADAAVAAEVAEIAKLEKLVRLNKSLCSLLRNFVSFQEFYKDKTDAIFQFGKLVLAILFAATNPKLRNLMYIKRETIDAVNKYVDTPFIAYLGFKGSDFH